MSLWVQKVVSYCPNVHWLFKIPHHPFHFNLSSTKKIVKLHLVLPNNLLQCFMLNYLG